MSFYYLYFKQLKMNLLFINIGSVEIVFLIIGFLPFLYTLYHIINNKRFTVNQKILWTFIILFGSLIGILIYWLWGRKNEVIGT